MEATRVRASSAWASVGKEITRRSAITLFLASGLGDIRYAAGQCAHAGIEQGHLAVTNVITERPVSIRLKTAPEGNLSHAAACKSKGVQGQAS
jgi:hypothetical protein